MPVGVPSAILKRGWIHRRGRSTFTNWKRRFATLETDGHKLTLSYYDKADGVLKGSVLILGADQILEVQGEQASRRRPEPHLTDKFD